MRAEISSVRKVNLPSDQAQPRWLRWESLVRVVFNILVVAAQLLGLFAFSLAGQLVVHILHLPIPGSLVGMVALFVLLSIGAVRVSWFERTGSFLIKHLAFFFIPITVGLMDAGAVLAESGVVIMATLIASAAIGFSASALICEILIARRGTPDYEN